MEQCEFDNLMRYKIAVGMAKSMLEKGMISNEEYLKIEQKMAEKYRINLTSIYRDLSQK